MLEITTPQFWVALLQIIGIDILLSGDNAVVIALACRSLPPQQQRWGIMLGTGAAIALRVIFAAGIVYLLAIPYLKLIGGLLLLWIAIKLLQPEPPQPEGGHHIDAKKNLWGAVQTIALADAVMSLDNVIGIAAAAKGSVLLLILGLLISIPLIVWGSTLILKLLHRYPFIVTLGGALLGWVAGDVLIADPVFADGIVQQLPWLHYAAPIACMLGVVIAGRWLAARTLAARMAATPASVVSSED